MLGQFMKNCLLRVGPTLKRLVKDCLLWEGPHAGAGDEREEEGAAGTKCYEPITTPIPCPPVMLGEGGGRVEPRKKQGSWGKLVLVLFLTILLCY